MNENKFLKEKIEEQQKQIDELTSELRKYKNENTPSGAIPYYEKENSYNRHKKSGQREGHAGVSRKKPENIDRKEKLILTVSPCCNAPVKEMNAKPKTRVVTHLIPPKIENVEYEKQRYTCTCCGKEIQPSVPNTIPNARFDLNFMILLSVLSVGMNLPYGKIKELLKFLWQLNVSEATISNNMTKLSLFLGPEHEKLKAEIRNAFVKYDDETGWRILGKGSWFWVFISKITAYYTIEWSRSKKVVKKVLGKKSHNINVTDGLRSYDVHKSQKQKCWAHVIRRFRGVPVFPFKSDKEKKDFRKLKNSIQLLFKRAKEEKIKQGVSSELRKKFEKKLSRILEWIYTGKNVEKILITIRNQKNDLFTFLEFEDVDPTNNRAERALRHAIVKRKISMQNRSMRHAQNYAMQLSVYQTAKLREHDYSAVIKNIVEQQINVGKF